MLSSKFVVVSFLYIFYATGLAAAGSNQLGGGNQLCQSVQTVTVTHTVAPGQPSPNKGNAPPPPAVTTPPGKVNLNNGGTTSVVKNTNTSSNPAQTNTKNVNKNGNGGNNNTNTSTVGIKTGNVDVGVQTSSVNANPSSTNISPPASTGTSDPNTSLTLDPSVIQNINGQGQAAGESNSLVSTNDFIGFCVGKTITNGQQNKAGSCNPTPMGDIPSVNNMPSSKFTSPTNFGTIAANTPFTISLAVNNFGTGTFTNADNTYFAAPQQLVGGNIQGHSHVTVQQMTSLNSPQPLNPKIFAFFKGLNAAAVNGILTADVTAGLPAGVYRISCITSAGNHQEALGPVAQRGSFNDVVYITVSGSGNSTGTTPPASSNISSSSVVNSTATLPGVTSTPPAVSSPASNGGNGGQGQNDTAPPVNSTSTEPPVVTTKGGKNGGKGGNVVSTPLPTSTTPPNGGNNTNNAASSSVPLPNSTPTKGGNKQGSKRMDRRSRIA